MDSAGNLESVYLYTEGQLRSVLFNSTLIAVWLIALFAVAAGAQSGDLRQESNGVYFVDEVQIEGNHIIPTESLLKVMKTHKGDRFDKEQIMSDLKAINALGFFDERFLEVDPELTSRGGVLLKIRVKENPPITKFSFRGNELISSDELSRFFCNQLGRPQNVESMAVAIEKVENLYHDRGYKLAKVTGVNDFPVGSVEIVVNEGKIEVIEIVGNERINEFVIRDFIKLKPGSVYDERQLTSNLRKLYDSSYLKDIRRSLAPSQSNPELYRLTIEVVENKAKYIGYREYSAKRNGFLPLDFSHKEFYRRPVLSYFR